MQPKKNKETGFEATTIKQSKQLANQCHLLHSEHQSKPTGEKEPVQTLRSFRKVLDYVEINNIVITCIPSSRYGNTNFHLECKGRKQQLPKESKAGYYKRAQQKRAIDLRCYRTVTRGVCSGSLLLFRLFVH